MKEEVSKYVHGRTILIFNDSRPHDVYSSIMTFFCMKNSSQGSSGKMTFLGMKKSSRLHQGSSGKMTFLGIKKSSQRVFLR